MPKRTTRHSGLDPESTKIMNRTSTEHVERVQDDDGQDKVSASKPSTSSTYNHQAIEKKWAARWFKDQLYQAPSPVDPKKKFYILPQLPYPSGSGLHVGHASIYVACDTYARYQRMKGKQVLQVIGWDAFGLPAENYAVKTNVHPKITINKAIDNFRYQLQRMGMSLDWDREVGSHNPDYYQWTQWFFLLMFKRGLAYRKKQAVNWCDSCKTTLANEQVVDGHCERCSTQVVQKDMEQWFLKITEYADQLYDDLDKIDWPAETVRGQRYWIGRKEGINITYKVKGSAHQVTCFTTRPDTNFGATLIVLGPEHPLALELATKEHQKEVQAYINKSLKKTELERISEGKEKTGVFTGSYAINNLNNYQMPIWISDFVLGHVGTGAVVGVPGHDKRDFQFALKYNLPVKRVVVQKNVSLLRSYLMGADDISDQDLKKLDIIIAKKTKSGSRKIEIPSVSLGKYQSLVKKKLTPGFWNEVVGEQVWFCFKDKQGQVTEFILDEDNREEIAQLCTEYNNDPIEKTSNIWAYLAANDWYTDMIIQEEEGIMVNSDFLDGLDIHSATQKIMDYLEKKGWGKRVTTYRLRDWLISRQRFWGTPIPIVYDPEGNPHSVDESDLPVLLPDDVDFKPTGQSPLTYSKEFQKGVEEKYGKGWRREVDTMDTFMCSSWYYYRYIDPKNDQAFASPKALKTWMPVDFYLGGTEHIYGHLLYSRFFTKVLKDAGFINFDEPFLTNRHQGLILGEDHRKMSKRWNNVINPTEVMDQHGADTLRLYEMFMGPLSEDKAWNTRGQAGIYRFIVRVWNCYQALLQSPNQDKTTPKLLRKLHQTIKKVGDDLQALKFNTAIAVMMEFINLWSQEGESLSVDDACKFLLILAPFAPFITEELWEQVSSQHPTTNNQKLISIHKHSWPEFAKELITEEQVEIPVQINGKLRATIQLETRNSKLETKVKDLALTDDKVYTWQIDQFCGKVGYK
jgi:leucyl-tRNA synthetase